MTRITVAKATPGVNAVKSAPHSTVAAATAPLDDNWHDLICHDRFEELERRIASGKVTDAERVTYLRLHLSYRLWKTDTRKWIADRFETEFGHLV